MFLIIVLYFKVLTEHKESVALEKCRDDAVPEQNNNKKKI